jgi:hypothetical protein
MDGTCPDGWDMLGCMGPGTYSSRTHGCGLEQLVREQMGFKSHLAIAVRTCVWAQSGGISGAGLNGRTLEQVPAWDRHTRLLTRSKRLRVPGEV